MTRIVPEPKPMQDMTEPELRSYFSTLAKLVEGVLPPGPSPTDKALFFMFVFDNSGVAQYVSNAERETMLAGLREIIARFEAEDIVDR